MTIQIPDVFKFLFEPARFKVLYGGRGSGKSVNIAKALLLQAAQKKMLILCCRELQSSIRESVHRLLCDEISEMGLEAFYEIRNTTIIGNNGSEFIFKGLRYNISEVKSMQAIDVAWLEEAANAMKDSWDVLIPTIRKPGSEIWVSFNPVLDTDYTYKMLVLDKRPDAVVRKVSWRDNPFFPDVLKTEMEVLKAKDPDSWMNVWEGHTRRTLDGAIYANQLREVEAAGRIGAVPYDPTKPVHTAWDLGFSDSTAIWLWQTVGLENRVIGYIHGSQHALPHYVQKLQALPYVYGTDWLPHDARAKQLGTGKSIEEMLRGMGRTVQIVPTLSLEDGINAARTFFPSCWFDAEKCADGLQALRHYRYDTDASTGQLSRKPLHDHASHGADAWRYCAIAAAIAQPKLPERPPAIEFVGPRIGGGTSWMA